MNTDTDRGDRTKRPNLLLFVPDGLQGRIVNAQECRTPAIDSLAARGVRFHNMHAPLPTCSPSRASIMTGVYPHNHGVLQVEHVVPDDQSVLRTSLPHWAQILSESGYRTGYFGKWHIERTNELERFGWQINGCDQVSSYRAIGSGVEDTGTLLDRAGVKRMYSGPDGYNDVLHYAVSEVDSAERRFAAITSNAADFVRQDGQEPWACMVSFSEPNTPLVAGAAAYAAYDADALSLPDSAGDTFEGSPALYRRQREIFSQVSDREWRELRACYMALVTELDYQLGRLLSVLEESGQADNTIVMVTGDHGRYVGAHGLDAHNFGAFEEAYGVPFVAAGPGVARAAETRGHVSLVDLYPTILELAGTCDTARRTDAEVPPVDGRSFLSLLADPAANEAGFDQAFAEYFGTRLPLMQRVLWKGDWKLVFNGFDYDELYNLADDPNELGNLGTDPAYKEVRRELTALLWSEIERTGDTTLLETHYPPMRMGAVGPNAGGAL